MKIVFNTWNYYIRPFIFPFFTAHMPLNFEKGFMRDTFVSNPGLLCY